MSESKHIAGPWRADIQYSPMIWAKTSAGDMRIADVRGWGHLTGGSAMKLPEDKALEIQNANALLIAAAPELLAALKLAEPFVADELAVRILSAEPMPTEAERGDIEDARTLAKTIEAAIAKAEGRAA